MHTNIQTNSKYSHYELELLNLLSIYAAAGFETAELTHPGSWWCGLAHAEPQRMQRLPRTANLLSRIEETTIMNISWIDFVSHLSFGAIAAVVRSCLSN